MTGQHALAVSDLETITDSSGAKIEAINGKIEELQEYFDSVVEMEFQRVSDPDGYADALSPKLFIGRMAASSQMYQCDTKREHSVFGECQKQPI